MGKSCEKVERITCSIEVGKERAGRAKERARAERARAKAKERTKARQLEAAKARPRASNQAMHPRFRFRGPVHPGGRSVDSSARTRRHAARTSSVAIVMPRLPRKRRTGGLMPRANQRKPKQAKQ